MDIIGQSRDQLEELEFDEADPEDVGECDGCGTRYFVFDREDHCAECGTCWAHCQASPTHRDSQDAFAQALFKRQGERP